MTFDPGPQILKPRACYTAVVLEARLFLVFGGQGGGGLGSYLAATEVLGTITEPMTVAPGPSMQTRRGGCAAVLLPAERRMIAVDGEDATTRHAIPHTTAEILDIDTMAFAPEPLMFSARSDCAIAPLFGSILMVGGRAGGGLAKTTEAPSLETVYSATEPTTYIFLLLIDHLLRGANTP